MEMQQLYFYGTSIILTHSTWFCMLQNTSKCVPSKPNTLYYTRVLFLRGSHSGAPDSAVWLTLQSWRWKWYVYVPE
jgi:hypothetical protein